LEREKEDVEADTGGRRPPRPPFSHWKSGPCIALEKEVRTGQINLEEKKPERKEAPERSPQQRSF